ncbi:AAA family ATPase [Streptosporangium sp. NBC_01755]|uniref:AAA family ATPase n=1 Tax=Streptosporangium sp. NBC_01755 TaxID=2975949 RepID=UPI002DD95FDD|nr:AAA family ATPase [Streptosporangium sp. NBC_01755]WSC99177.1 AAA family ATPase [Streptosporangium sp. NBC_01755]
MLAEGPHGPTRTWSAGVTERGARWRDDAPEFLADRERQISLLGKQVTVLRRGRPGVVTVLGEPGMGRSALLRVVVARAREAGLLAVLARCSPAEADLRYSVLSQITAGLAGAGYPAFARRLWAEEQPAATLIPALCGEFVALARNRPLLIALDDARWADEGSKAWLAAMTHRLRYAPILLVQAGAPGEGCAVGPVTEPGSVPRSVIHVPPLREHGVWQVIVSRYAGHVDGAFVAAATEATGGSPAALLAVLDHFVGASLPPVARYVPVLLERAAEVSGDRVATVISRLPADALALLLVMAVCGDGLDFDLLTSLAPLRTMSSEQALSVLVRLGLVTDGKEPRPAGPLVADKALAGMEVGERQALAMRAVQLGYRAAIPEERLARLLLNTRPVGAEWVVSLLSRVATQRRLDGDHEGAAALLGRALREPVRDEQRQRLLIELAMMEVDRSSETSDRRLQQVLLNSGTEVPVVELVRAADLLASRGDASATYRAVATAYARREAGGADLGSLAAIGWLAENDCTIDDSALPVHSFPDPSDQPGDPVRAGIAAWMLAIRGKRLPRVRELARTAFQVRGEDQPFGPRIHAAKALLLADEVAEAVIGLDEVLADARRCGARAPAALALIHRGRCEIRRGNLGQAACDFEAARAELPLTSWHPRLVPFLVAMEAYLHLAGGSVEKAEQSLAFEFPSGADQGAAWAVLLYMRARVRMELADPKTALRDINESGRVLLARGWTNPAVLPWRSVGAAAHSACGNAEAARRLAMEAVERAREWGAPSALGMAHLCASRVLNGAEAMSELEHAVRVLRDSVSRDCYAMASAELVAASAVARKHAGTPSLTEAAMKKIDMPPGGLTERSRRPATKAVETRYLLTSQEERVAGLIAAGHSNTYIASILSVSVRTVELRLTAIYRKLAVTNRNELASLLASIPAPRNMGD